MAFRILLCFLTSLMIVFSLPNCKLKHVTYYLPTEKPVFLRLCSYWMTPRPTTCLQCQLSGPDMGCSTTDLKITKFMSHFLFTVICSLSPSLNQVFYRRRYKPMYSKYILKTTLLSQPMQGETVLSIPELSDIS